MKMIMTLLSLLGLVACSGNYTNLAPEEFAKAIESGEYAVLDVRTPEEYAEGHLHNAANVNWFGSDFVDQVKKGYPANTPLAVYCRSGKRSGRREALEGWL